MMRDFTPTHEAQHPDFEARLERWLNSTTVARCLVLGFILAAGIFAAVMANANLILEGN